MTKIWANSGDSHFLEPDDLWFQIMPAEFAERMPRSERIGDDEEIVHVDGQSFRRKLPKIMTRERGRRTDDCRAQLPSTGVEGYSSPLTRFG